MSDKALLTVNNLSAGYNRKNILNGISFEIFPKQIVGLLGANGCGKTTLIKSLCRIIPSAGEISIKGENVSSWSNKKFAKSASLVPQRSGIGIDISVLDVVLMGFNPFLSFLERPSKKMVEKAENLIVQLGLKDKMHSNFLTLSEGQKQLVVIARALVIKTPVLFMDEPESSLDFSVRYDVMGNIRSHVEENEACALVSLHDINLALNFCDKLLLIKNGKINSSVDVRNEDISSIEQKLKDVYGEIRLVRIKENSGKESMVMVKD